MWGRIGSPCEIWEVRSILVFDEFGVGGDGKLEIKYDFFVFVLFLRDLLKLTDQLILEHSNITYRIIHEDFFFHAYLAFFLFFLFISHVINVAFSSGRL